MEEIQNDYTINNFLHMVGIFGLFWLRLPLAESNKRRMVSANLWFLTCFVQFGQYVSILLAIFWLVNYKEHIGAIWVFKSWFLYMHVKFQVMTIVFLNLCGSLSCWLKFKLLAEWLLVYCWEFVQKCMLEFLRHLSP